MAGCGSVGKRGGRGVRPPSRLADLRERQLDQAICMQPQHRDPARHLAQPAVSAAPVQRLADHSRQRGALHARVALDELGDALHQGGAEVSDTVLLGHQEVSCAVDVLAVMTPDWRMAACRAGVVRQEMNASMSGGGLPPAWAQACK